MNDNNTPNGNGDKKNNGKFPKNTQNMMMFLVFLMIGILLWGLVRDQYQDATTQEITYDTFVDMLESDEIASVEDTGTTWKITPKEQSQTGLTQSYYTGKMSDDDLLPLMKEKGVYDHMEYYFHSGANPSVVAGIWPAYAPYGRWRRHDGCRQEQSQGLY